MMNKQITGILLVLFTAFSLLLSVSAADLPLFVDDAQLTTDDEYAEIRSELESISAETGLDVVIVTIDALPDGTSSQAYADDVFDDYHYGQGNGRDGILFLIAPAERDFAISTHGRGVSYFTDAGLDYIVDEMIVYLSDDQYADAFRTFARNCEQFIEQGESGKPYDGDDMPGSWTTSFLIALGIGLVLAFLITGSMKSQLKTVAPAGSAGNYTKEDSLNVTKSRDVRISSNVTRSKIEKSSSSDSSGGSSTHTSSSGSTHGGTSGKY